MTHKLLLPVDGSDNALRAVDYAAALVKDGLAAELHLANAQPGVGGMVTAFVARADVDDYHRDEAMKALQPALDRLAAQGLTAEIHIGVGDAAEVIVAFCEQLGCDQVVMGARGLGAAASLLLGSVSRDVVKNAKTPVTLVK
jgi:nucleotide-binding universal stress UspA family protein